MNVRRAIRNALLTEEENEEAAAVAAYAEVYRLKQQLKKLEEHARDLVLDLYEGQGKTAITGAEGVVTVSIFKGAKRLDNKIVRKLLTPAQLEQAEVIGKPTTSIKFTPKSID